MKDLSKHFKPCPKPSKKLKKKPAPIKVRSKKMLKEELQHVLKVKELGCAVAEQAKLINDPCQGSIEYHHITSCGRRLGHKIGIPLCVGHHRTGKISIGQSKKTFIKTYGFEIDIMEKIKKLILELFPAANH